MIFAFFNNPGAGAAKYLLRDLVDAPLPHSVAWWPQTIGWAILLAVAILFLCVKLVQQARHWWQNRYRTEAAEALAKVDLAQTQTALLHIHQILQLTIRYAYPNIASTELYGHSLISFLERTGDVELPSTLGAKWQNALNQPSLVEQISRNEILEIQTQLVQWAKQHTVTASIVEQGDDHV
ncbi:DUF4381 domain-containing protein [Thalassotalea atypica]|uniref:DUF4381 domain-containing protein n=1 Tax=Thalassotalea atypica TaxID=2054316 RepID=UPI0025724F93|nr:DUF4381 domain-containing protein [Thalassotalea atypica]